MSDNIRYTWLIPTALGGIAGLLFGVALSAAGGRPVIVPYTLAGVVAGLAGSVYMRLRGT